MPRVADPRRGGDASACRLSVSGGLVLLLLFSAPAGAGEAPGTTADAAVVERSPNGSPFSTHRENYLIIGPEDSPVAGNTTSKFQLSLKYDVGADWYLAYGQRVYWDLTRPSGPVLDINFEPELFYRWQPRSGFAERAGLAAAQFGFVHESNGKRGADSRAWNRFYVEPHFRWRGFFLEPKLWAIISTDDQNRDIADYSGYADLAIGYETGSGQRYRLTGRQGAQHGSVRFDLSFPIQSMLPDNRMRPYLYLQAWAGYGETLLYYNLRTTAVRLGLEFHP